MVHLQMSKARCANLASVGSVATVRNKVDTHLALGCFDSRVRFSWWNVVAFREELEVVNERLHALLHRGSRWWYELVVVDLVLTRGHFLQTLADDVE